MTGSTSRHCGNHRVWLCTGVRAATDLQMSPASRVWDEPPLPIPLTIYQASMCGNVSMMQQKASLPKTNGERLRKIREHR